MADQLQDILRKLQQSPRDYKTSSDLLSKAKLILLKSKALTPQPSTPSALLPLAREVYETGALVSIRNKDTEAFTRYFNLLTPFYELPADRLSGDRSQKNKITGLYLLLLLTMGNYSGFYIARESMAVRKEDQYAGYPIKLESWLQEGRYDQAWKMITSREIPSEEYGVFSEVSPSMSSLTYHRELTQHPDPSIPNPIRDSIQRRSSLPIPPRSIQQRPPLPRQ